MDSSVLTLVGVVRLPSEEYWILPRDPASTAQMQLGSADGRISKVSPCTALSLRNDIGSTLLLRGVRGQGCTVNVGS